MVINKSIIFGGAEVVKNSYITKYSQNTLYYQKFNVSGKSALASHQYQQNIMAAQSQGASLKNYYGTSNTAQTYTFIIPLYENIPATISPRPDVTKANSINYEDGIVQNISTSLKVRASANGTAIGALNNNESIKILEKAQSPINGYLWDLIVSNVDGTYGYAARVVGNEICIVPTGTTGSSSGTAETPAPPVEEPPVVEEPEEPEEVVVDIEKDIALNGEYIDMIPEVTCEHITEKYENAIIKDKDGNTVEEGNLGTGYSVTVGEEVFKIVKKGDLTGDGKVSIIDAITLLNGITGKETLENEFKSAACITKVDTFSIMDAITLLNYITGKEKISL